MDRKAIYMAKNQKSCGFRTTIGGQALIEGILMRGPEKQVLKPFRIPGDGGQQLIAALVVQFNIVLLEQLHIGIDGILKLAELPFVKQKFYKGSSKARGSGIGLAVWPKMGYLSLTRRSSSSWTTSPSGPLTTTA